MSPGAERSAAGEELLIRDMNQGDVCEVLAIDRAVFSVPWTEESFRKYLDRPEAVFLVACCRGRIVGYGSVILAADQGDIANVAVRPDHRRQRIGNRLVAALIDRAKARGARELFLEVRESNDAARALYEGAGFSEVGRRKNYYHLPTEDALILRRVEEGEGTPC